MWKRLRFDQYQIFVCWCFCISNGIPYSGTTECSFVRAATSSDFDTLPCGCRAPIPSQTGQILLILPSSAPFSSYYHLWKCISGCDAYFTILQAQDHNSRQQNGLSVSTKGNALDLEGTGAVDAVLVNTNQVEICICTSSHLLV